MDVRHAEFEGNCKQHSKKEWKRVKGGTKSKNSVQEFDQYLNGLINHDYEETNSRGKCQRAQLQLEC